MKKSLKVVPVDVNALRGLVSHAESHWLTFATAMRCYAHQPTRPLLHQAVESHGPTWLRVALHGEPKRQIRRPLELEPSGSLAYLTAGAEEALKKPDESSHASVRKKTPAYLLAPQPLLESKDGGRKISSGNLMIESPRRPGSL